MGDFERVKRDSFRFEFFSFAEDEVLFFSLSFDISKKSASLSASKTLLLGLVSIAIGL